jgi:protein SCO1/2
LKRNISIWFFLLLWFLIAFGVYAAVQWFGKKESRLPVYGKTVNGKPHTISEFSLMDQEGKIMGTDQWKDRIVVANFFFTHCPSICPKMNANLKNVEIAFSEESGILINSFTVDPERDSPRQLAAYAKRFSVNADKWKMFTGDKKEIYRLARKSFLLTAADGDGGPQDFIHSDKLVLIDKHRRIRGYYSGTETGEVEQLISDIKKLQHEN